MFGLYLVVTNPLTSYEACTEAAVQAGVRFVQLRMKNAMPEEILTVARRMRDITHGTETLFIVNDDPELAVAAEADGVHVGQDDMPLPEARARFPQLRIFGLSTHSEEQMRRALQVKPDYIGVGPVFATPTKAIPDPVVGVERAGAILREAAPVCPGLAIGGIDETNLAAVLAAGAQNYAVVRAVCRAEDPYAAIRRLQAVAAKGASNQ